MLAGVQSLAVAPTAVELALRAVELERAAQKPEELALLIEWLTIRDNPRAVLEVGVYRGGTLWLWRRLWPHARIVAVDNMSLERCPGCERRVAHRDCSNRRIADALGGWPRGRLLVADSHEARTRELVALWLGRGTTEKIGTGHYNGRCDFLHLDGDHSAAGVRRDFELYSPLVRAGGAIVLHDVAGDAFPGVVELWRELSESEPAAFLILAGREDWGGLGVLPR